MTLAKNKPPATPDIPTFAISTMQPGQLREMIDENLGGQISASGLDTIKVPAAGGSFWSLPTLEGDEAAKEFSGIIIHAKNTRSYWPGEQDPDGSPPQCYSDDGVLGRGAPGGSCALCPLAQYGSSTKGSGEGQACKQQKVLYVVRPDDTLPVLVRLPPTSLKAFNSYATRLVSRGLKLHDVVTRFSLEQDQSNSGIKYSRVVPSLNARVTTEQLTAVRAYAGDIKPALARGTAAALPAPDTIQSDDLETITVDPYANAPEPATPNGPIDPSEADDLFPGA